MKRTVLLLLALAAAVSCGKKHRFDYIDVAASERTRSALEAGFNAVPDSITGGRTAYLLSQGIPMGDVLVYAGEGETVPLPEMPEGYAFQRISTAELLDSLHIKGGRLYTDGGRNGRLLYLSGSRFSLPVLLKIASLAENGALIGGTKPRDPLEEADRAVFQRTVERVWMSGNVMSGKTLKSLLSAAGVRPDVESNVDSLYFEHRHLPDADIYYLKNRGNFSGRARLTFQVRGREPLVWNPDSGQIVPVSYKLKKRATRVWMNIVPGDETFVVFASFAEQRKRKVQ